MVVLCGLLLGRLNFGQGSYDLIEAGDLLGGHFGFESHLVEEKMM